MSFNKAQRGFSAVEVLVVLVIIGLLGGAGYYVYSQRSNDTKESATATDVQAAPEINDAEDLDTAEAALDANDPELSSGDLDKLDKELEDVQ